MGCAKGFMLYDFSRFLPGISLSGVDISNYAISNAIEPMKECLQVADALNLPFEDNSFDLVISITTVHNFDRKDCIKSLNEISRVSKNNCFITVDAYRNEIEKNAMFAWNLTAKTMLHTREWENLFDEAGYDGDYYWFIP